MADLSCYRGDTAVFTEVATHDGAIVDLTDGSVVMTARRNYTSPILFQKTATLADDPTTGAFSVKLAEDDTLQLSNQKTVLVYDMRATTAGGDEFVVAIGTLTVNPDVSV